jgi:hypothetical protein
MNHPSVAEGQGTPVTGKAMTDQRWSATMSEDRLSLKLNIVCLLLFLNGVAAVICHPNWFQ